MSIGKILVPVTGAGRDLSVLRGALAAANLFEARLEVLFVRPDPVEAMPFYGEGMSSSVVQEIMDVSKDAASKASRAARENLEKVKKEGGSTPEERFRFREVEGNFAEQVTVAARLSDLVVFGPVKEDDRPGLGEAFDATLLETGRPVLLLPESMPAGLGSRISLAWNGSVASAHAISAALPFLKKAAAVEVLTVKRGNSIPSPTDELIRYLACHGIAADARMLEAGDLSVADALLKSAAENGGGMLVAGGYGHNRMRELFVTGTTRRVVAQAAIPCFLVH